jgi:hypothetical protein
VAARDQTEINLRLRNSPVFDQIRMKFMPAGMDVLHRTTQASMYAVAQHEETSHG